ncbi:hypothetical protein ACQQJ8_000522 [Campylobacter coli]
MKRAIITGGAFHNQNFFKVNNGKFGDMFQERIYLPELKTTDLMVYDYIVIASRLNVGFLLQNKDKFLEYLKNGGHIVSFGDIKADYLPHIDFKEAQVNFWWWIHKGADLPLYQYDKNNNIWQFLDIKECKWHYHGFYNIKEGCEKIIVDELGRSILYKDAISFKGNMYVTSLDPDYHIGQGFMPVTIPFLEKFMSWIEEDIRHK